MISDCQQNTNMPQSAATSKNIIWDYFTVCESDKSKAICIFCKKMLSRGSTDPHKQTLTGMKNHIKTQHNAIFKKLESTATTHSLSSAHATAASTSATASTSKTGTKSIDKFCISRPRPAQPTLPSSSASESQTGPVAVSQLQEQAGDCSMATSSDCDVSLSDVVEEEAAISVFSSSSMREGREMRQVRNKIDDLIFFSVTDLLLMLLNIDSLNHWLPIPKFLA